MKKNLDSSILLRPFSEGSDVIHQNNDRIVANEEYTKTHSKTEGGDNHREKERERNYA